MQYFVTFTLLRSSSPSLFISGDRSDGRATVREQLRFTSLEQLRDKLDAASLPGTVADQDLLHPTLVSAEQLRTLGVTLP